jgi:cytoskeleton protein RodZ
MSENGPEMPSRSGVVGARSDGNPRNTAQFALARQAGFMRSLSGIVPPLRAVLASSRDDAAASGVGSPVCAEGADVGAALKEARHRLAMSLEELERLTKIRVPVLLAIEANHRDQLPEPVFARGFIRAYAREVGLNPEDTVRRYFGQFAPVSTTVEHPTATESNAASTKLPIDEALARDERWDAGRQWAVIALVLAVSVVVYTVGQRWTPSPTPASTTGQSDGATDGGPASSSATAPDRPETGTAGSHSVAGPAATDGTLRVDILAQGSCWVAATVDGVRVVTALMQAGERHALAVREGAVLRVGNAGAFAYSINGVSGRPLGRAGQVVTVRITPDNYREFIGQ